MSDETSPGVDNVNASPNLRKGGRPREHGYRKLRETLRDLTTRRLDGRSKVALAVKALKAEIASDLGGDLSKAQSIILEDVATTWIIRSTIDDFILRQQSIVTKKRALIPIVSQRMAIAEHLARQLDRLGLKRTPRAIPSLAEYVQEQEAAARQEIDVEGPA